MADHATGGGEALSQAEGAVGTDAALIEAGRRLFAGEVRFVFGVARRDGLPASTLPELAFAGRSNVGKSSLVNALTGRKSLARISRTPGRTRQLNFFELGGRLMLVDLPGYGYAAAPKGEISAWQRLIRAYLRGRPGLRRLFLLVDARHGLKDGDRDMMRLLDEAAVSYQIVLTKADKVADSARAEIAAAIAAELAKHPAGHPDVMATSALSGSGIAALRAAIAALAAKGQFG